MRHTRDEVIQRTQKEFKLLDKLVANLSEEEWARPLGRPETKDPWTVKDALAHITYWKANVIRSIHRDRLPAEMRGLKINDGNHVIYMQWHGRSPQEVLDWHRQVQKDLVAALRQAPEDWFSSKDRKPDWPFDLDGHSANHRVKDIEQALKSKK